MFFKRKKENLNRLLEIAIESGLREEDSKAVIEFINSKEYGLALDTMVCQLYEYDNEISQSFFDEIQETAKSLGFSKDQYSYLEKNIRVSESIPIAVQDKIGEICSDIKRNKEI